MFPTPTAIDRNLVQNEDEKKIKMLDVLSN